MAFKRTQRASVSVENAESLFKDLRNRSVTGLLAHQADTLRAYHKEAVDAADIAIQLPTGSGKTLVGLLLGEWRRRHFKHNVAYLCPTRQLVHQVVEQGRSYGIRAIPLVGRQADYAPADRSDYLSGEAVAVTTYSGVFNTNSFFDGAGTLICDDAHAAENYVATFWSVLISKKDHSPLFDVLTGALKGILAPGDYTRLRAGTSSLDRDWVEKLPTPLIAPLFPEIIALIDAHVGDSKLRFPWSVIRDYLHACQFYVAGRSILIRPLIPPTHTHRPFAQPKQRVYMSATLGAGGELERIWGRRQIQRLPSQGWDRQGIGRRLFFFPERSLDEANIQTLVVDMIKETPRALVLVPDDRSAQEAGDAIAKATGYSLFNASQLEGSKAPFVQNPCAVAVVANRYDGIDLVGDECRLLIVDGLPQAINLQERFLVVRMGASALLTERILTRIAQAVGRCTRSPTDYAAVVVIGDSFHRFLLRPEHRALLHPEIQAEVEFGIDQSKDADIAAFVENFKIFLQHGDDWNSVDQDIIALRDKINPRQLEATAKLKDAVPSEVEYQVHMWDGNFEGALEAARAALAKLTGNEITGYRAFWNYLAGSAAWLAFKSGVAPMEGVARDHFGRAEKASTGIRWLMDLTRFTPEAREPVGPDRALAALIEGLEGELERLGTLHTRKLDAEIKFITENLAHSDANSFEAAHERLGRLLGYDAGNDNGTAAPDPWWRVGDQLCIVFEDHTDCDGKNPLGANKVRQAGSHPSWIRANVPLSADAEVVPAIVTPCTKLDHGAEPHVGELCYWHTADFRSWANEALSVVRKLWREFPGPGDLAWRANAMKAYQEAGLDPAGFVKKLRNSLLKELPIS